MRLRVTLRNAGDQPQEATLRIHPAIAVSDANATRLIARGAGDAWRRYPLPGKPTDHPANTDRTFEGDDQPRRAWGVLETDTRRALVNRVVAGDGGRYFAHMSWPDGRVTLELWSPTRVLAPNQTIVIEHAYELIAAWPEHP